MDKITHQVRAEHWAKIMNECINSGMSKTAWCRANGISPEFIITGNCRFGSRVDASDSENGLFYRGQASIIFSEHSSGFPSRSCDPKRQPHPGDFEFCFG